MSLVGPSRRRTLLVAAVLVACAALGYLVGALSFNHSKSSYVSIEKDVTGTVQTISSDGDGISIRLSNGDIVNTAVVNAGQFSLRRGQTVTAALMEVSAPADKGASTQQSALIVSAH